MLKKKDSYVSGNMTTSMRKIGIDALVQALDEVCNKHNCEAAAQRIGLHPVSSDSPKASPYVREPTEYEQKILEERRTRTRESLKINCFELMTNDKIAEIKEYVGRSEKDKLLCRDISEFSNLQELFKFIKEHAEANGVHVLSTPPSFRGLRFDI